MVNVDKEPDKVIAEVVKMLENGSLEIMTEVRKKNGPHGTTGWVAEPGDPDFVEFSTRHGISKPGQMSTIVKELIDGTWRETHEQSG